MSKWRILGRVLGVVVICVGLFYLWVDYSIRRSLRLAFGPTFSADVQDLSVAIKGQMGAFYLGKMSDLPIQSDGRTVPDKTNQLLTAYRRNPEKFLQYAKFSDTVLSASIVGNELLKTPPPRQLPGTSDEVSSLRPDLRKDPWGRPFCIISTSNLILVVSFGPKDHPPFVCQSIHIDNEIRKSERRVFQMPSGEVILKINRDSGAHPLAQVLSSVPSTPD